MFIPIHDGVALRYLQAPVANWALIGLNIAIFIVLALLPERTGEHIDLALGTIPAVLNGGAELGRNIALVAPSVTLVTGMFLHGSLAHLVGNMLFLWVFGDNVEDAMGSLRYAGFYLGCGVVGALAYSLALPDSQAPLIGASAAISGVVVAYLLLYPLAGVFGLVFSVIPLRIPAWIVVGGWVLLQIASALVGADPGVGWWAHVGGIAAGIVLLPLLKRREVPLFGSRRS